MSHFLICGVSMLDFYPKLFSNILASHIKTCFGFLNGVLLQALLRVELIRPKNGGIRSSLTVLLTVQLTF